MGSLVTYLLFFLSGTTALVYELVWVRELVFVFGGTTYAITTVLVAFMAGLGLGSVLAGRVSPRLERPARVFGYLEIGIGVYAVLVPFLLSLALPAYRAIYPSVSDQPWLLAMIRFALSAPIMLLPATLMGATLPVMVRHVTHHGGALGQSVGQLYGINTLGAVLGVVLAGFLLLPAVGLNLTTWLAASVDVLVGVLAISILGGAHVTARPEAPSGKPRDEAPHVITRGTHPALYWTVLVGFALSGFAAMVYQITWTRALVMSLGSSTYSFTCILAAFILGLALGSLAIARFVDRVRNPAAAFGVLELLIGVVAVFIVPINMSIPYWAEVIVQSYKSNYSMLLAAQFLLIIAITFIPTLLMGAIFPLVIRTLATSQDDAGAVTGRAYGVNTIGTILGSFLGGFVLIRSDVLGVQNSIIFASVLNGLVGAALLAWSAGPTATLLRRLGPAVVSMGVILAIGLGVGRWDPAVLSSGVFLARQSVADFIKTREVLYVAEGADLTVTVDRGTDTPTSYVSMRVNGKPDASTGVSDMTNFMLLGHIPALVAPPEGDVCIIGLGAGLTLASTASHADYERIDCVEISSEVIEAAEYFADVTNHVVRDDPRVNMIRADGRNHLLLTDRKYELIVSQPSNPWLAGVSNLFTREFFQLCNDALTDDGVLAIWLQSYTMSQRDFNMIVRTLNDEFERISLWQLWASDYMLLASRTPHDIDLADFARRFNAPAVRLDLYRIGVERPAHLLGRYATTGDRLRELVSDAPIHTDDNALLEFSAPRYLYIQQSDSIAVALDRLQGSIFDDLVSDATPPTPLLRRETESVVAARRALFEAKQRFPAVEQQADALRYLLDVYRESPFDVNLYEALRGAAESMPTQPPSVGALKHEIETIQQPLFVPPAGATLADVVRFHVIRGADAMTRGHWGDAAFDLLEARRFQPEHPQVQALLGRVLMRAGAVPEVRERLDRMLSEHPTDPLANYVAAAVACQSGDLELMYKHLDAALATGQINPTDVIKDPKLDGCKDDPRFAALVEQYRRDDEPNAP